MTVGFLLNTSEPFYRGGYESRSWSFARELVRMGHEARIYTSCPRDETIEGVHFIRVGPVRPFFNARGVRNGWADLLFSLNVLRLLGSRGLRDLDALDVCATPFVHLPFVALVCWFRRVPVMITCHEALLASIPAYTRERGNKNGLAAWFFTRLFSLIYRLGMALFPCRLANSYRTETALAKEGYPAAGVVETGLDPNVFSDQPPGPLPETEAARFVFCGRLTPIKSVDQTVAALLSLRGETAPFHFDVVGEGSERAGLERMAREARAESAFTFHGEVSEETKLAVLGRNEIFVLSSPREGLSLATLEAMARGCGALIVNDPKCPTGALDFIHDQEQGLVVPPGVEPMREALRSLIGDRGRRLAFRRAAWQKAQEYAVEGRTTRLVAFYQEKLGRKA